MVGPPAGTRDPVIMDWTESGTYFSPLISLSLVDLGCFAWFAAAAEERKEGGLRREEKGGNATQIGMRRRNAFLIFLN